MEWSFVNICTVAGNLNILIGIRSNSVATFFIEKDNERVTGKNRSRSYISTTKD